MLTIEQINKLEQENAELKALSEELGKIIECKNGTIATLAKTRDELKAQKDKYYQQTLDDEIQINELYQKIERLKAENETLNYQWDKQSEIGDEWYKLAEKYKVALQGIKAIADENKDTAQYGGICKSILMVITKAESEG